MIKFCTMLSYFGIIFVLIVSGIVSEENNAFSFENETVIDNENQTLKVKDHRISKDDVLVDLKPKISPATNKTLHLSANGNNKDQKDLVLSKVSEVQLDESGTSHNWKDFQNGTFSTTGTVVNKANKTVKIKIRKIKLNHNILSLDRNTNITSNYTDQEPGSSIQVEISSVPQNRKSLEIENDKRFEHWKTIGTNSVSDTSNKNLTRKSENWSKRFNFEVNRNSQQNSTAFQNIIPSQPELRLETPATFSIIQNSTQNTNDWHGIDTVSKDSNIKNEKVDLFQNFSQSFNEEKNSTTPPSSNGTSSVENYTIGVLEEYQTAFRNGTNFKVDLINFDNSNDWKGIDFGTNETIKINDQEAQQGLNFQQNVTLENNNDKYFETQGNLNQFKIQYLNENRNLFQNNNQNLNRGSDWPSVENGVPSVTKNKTSKIRNQVVNVLNNTITRFIDNNLRNLDNNRNFKEVRFNSDWKTVDVGVLPVTTNTNSTFRNEIVKTSNNSVTKSIDSKSSNNQNNNFNQIWFDDSDWKAIVGVYPVNSNKTSTGNLPNNSSITYVYGESTNKIMQPPPNKTLDFSTKGRYADYQPSGSADNFHLQPLGENYGEINLDTLSHGDNQEPSFDEDQISKPSIDDEFDHSNFEDQVTEKFIDNSNWNFAQEEWKAINGNSKHPHIGTKTEIKIENHIPFPYPIEKNVFYPVEKQVPFPIKVDVPSPYPIVKEVHVPKKVTVPIPVPIYTPVPVEKVVKYPVRVPVDQPYPVSVKVPHYYPVEVQIPFPVKVKVPKPFPIIKKVPYEVKHIYHVPKPFPVHKKVYYPVKVHFERLVRYNVYKPFPYKVVKNVYFPYYIEKPYPVKVYEDKGVGQKPPFFKYEPRPIENHKPFLFDQQPESIPVYEDNQEKPPSALEESNNWKVNYDPFGEINA